jgi:hypothetical protein
VRETSVHSGERAHFIADCAAGYNKTVLPSSGGGGGGSSVAPSVGAPIAAQHVGAACSVATTALCGAVAGHWTHFPSIELAIDDVCLEFAERSGSAGGGGAGAGTMSALLDLDELLTFKCFLRSAKGGPSRKAQAQSGGARVVSAVQPALPGDVLVGSSTVSLRWLLSAQPTVLAPHSADAGEGGGFINALDANPFDLRPMDLLGSAMALLGAATEKEDEVRFVPSGRAALPVSANLCSIYITRVALDGGCSAAGGGSPSRSQRCALAIGARIDDFLRSRKQTRGGGGGGAKVGPGTAPYIELHAVFERKLELEDAISSLQLDRVDSARSLKDNGEAIVRLRELGESILSSIEARVRRVTASGVTPPSRSPSATAHTRTRTRTHTAHTHARTHTHSLSLSCMLVVSEHERPPSPPRPSSCRRPPYLAPENRTERRGP